MHSKIFILAAVAALASAQFYPADQIPVLAHNSVALENENETIFTQLNSNPKFSRIVKAINISESIVQVLNDSSASITFFAVPNWAIPHRRPKSTGDIEGLTLSELVPLLEDLDVELHDDKRKRLIKKVLEAILNYHILPAPFDLSSNTTFPTRLTLPGALDDNAQRIKVQMTLFPPTMSINLRTLALRRNIKAKNGLLHIIDRPLIPPPSLFTEMFMATRAFSTFTSALLNSDLKDDLHIHWKNKTFEGSTTTSVFAPSSIAFDRLPGRLKLFLFSPFGARALKKLLQYHIIPEHVLHSDYIYNATSKIHAEEFIPDSMPVFEEFVSFGEMHAYDVGPRESEEFLPGGRLRPLGDPEMDISLSPWIRPDAFRIHQRCNNTLLKDVRSCFENMWTGFGNTTTSLKPPTLISALNLTVPTLLSNYSMNIHIARYNVSLPLPRGHGPHAIRTKMFVNGHEIPVTDIVAANGVLHATHSLLDPRGQQRKELNCAHKPVDDEEYWKDWEEWLPQWAMEE